MALSCGVLSALWALSCSAPPGARQSRSDSAPIEPYSGNSNPSMATPVAPPLVTPSPAPSSEGTPNLNTAVNMEGSSAALPEPEAPLSPAELQALGQFDGLVRAPGSTPVSAQITETTVARAYLDWKARFFKSCDNGTVYVLKNDYTGSEEIVSEGIGYGMLMSVAIGDRDTFGGLWEYYRSHRNGNGVMNWRQSVCGGDTGGNGASDADLDAALGLVLAESRWGGYRQDALDLISAIGTHETEECDNGQLVLKPGDSWGGCGGQTVNPSYFSPGHYRRFALLQTERADFWNDFASDTYAMLSGMQDQNDGLVPDWGFGDGRSEGGDRGQFGYEAVRNPWRVALDLAWTGNPDARSFLQRMSQTVDARGGIAAMADAESFEDKRNSAFLGSLSLSGLAVSEQKLHSYVQEWQAYEELDDQWYYQATLRVLFLMTAGGFFPSSY
ncbi:MAG TPA: glycosyl hydrolase family 8 [Polyangiaceae bacterium]|nr:glycosyl hydrolase family 8 [Polyangiaceae bacterium]